MSEPLDPALHHVRFRCCERIHYRSRDSVLPNTVMGPAAWVCVCDDCAPLVSGQPVTCCRCHQVMREVECSHGETHAFLYPVG